jgi:hypothetical protein
MFVYIPFFAIFMWERKQQKRKQKLLNSFDKNYFLMSRIICLVIIEIDMCMCIAITCIWMYWICSIRIYCYRTNNNLAAPLVKREKKLYFNLKDNFFILSARRKKCHCQVQCCYLHTEFLDITVSWLVFVIESGRQLVRKIVTRNGQPEG